MKRLATLALLGLAMLSPALMVGCGEEKAEKAADKAAVSADKAAVSADKAADSANKATDAAKP